ncbi:putative FAD-linked oxidoreductase [Halioglobus japonicus]|nr:putative FAD-linked oxidoreductase [Halioglobus japonicus]
MTERSGLLDGDHSEAILAALRSAREQKSAVYIRAGGSKQHIIGRDCAATELDVSAHRGIVDYQPQELVIAARAGTPLSEIVTALAAENQCLPFEPPLFGGKATLGGTLACNLSGPGRPWRGSIRDMVLGVQMINGKCEQLNFGGKVMKNVAGYDVSRLQAGALGTLGVLTEISLKILPRPQKTLTLRYAMPADEAIETMNRCAGKPKPLSGAFWQDETLYLRLSGAASAVDSTALQWGGDTVENDEALWQELREQALPFFAGDEPLWRFSVQSSARLVADFGPMLIDWGGAQRWVRGDHARDQLNSAALDAGGHVSLFRGGDRESELQPPLNTAAQRLQQQLKKSFDPDGIVNPGRLYSWL